MKSIGRVILLIVGGMTIVSAISDFSAFIDGLKISSASNFFEFIKSVITDEAFRTANLAYLTSGLKALGLIVISALAILAGIFGRCGFWFTIAALVLLGFFIYDIYGKYKSGVFSDTSKLVQTIASIITDSLTQIGFILGFIFVKLGKKE